MKARLSFEELNGLYAVCRLDAAKPVPAWVPTTGFVSITRTLEEVSIVCLEDAVPQGEAAEYGWRCFRISGTLDFSLVGILAEVADCLAQSGISLFCISTHDTDYFLVKDHALARARASLEERGHTIIH